MKIPGQLKINPANERAALFELPAPVLIASQFTTGTAFFQYLWDRAAHYTGGDVCAEDAFRARPALRPPSGGSILF